MTILINMILAGTAPAGQSTEDLAKAAQNPIAAMISLPFQNNTNFKVGPEEKTQNVLNIQPVWPIDLSTDLNLITRTIVPVISQPATQMGQERTNGIGDVQFSAFFSPKLPTANGWIWGGGFIAQLDTSSNEVLGTGKWKWGLGPTAVALKMDGQWVYGALINNAWSIAGDDNRADVNAMLAQPFINYNLPDNPGRYITFAPVITANWEASNDDRWTIPLGLGIGQILLWGQQPINLSASAYYNVKSPEYGADWQLRL